MNRGEFMKELRLKLARLPEEELSAAVEYYEEYFDEAGPEREEAIIRELGSPSQVAKQIMGDRVLRAVESKPISPKKSLSTVWIVLLAIFASPIAFPLAIAFVAVVFAIVVTVGALILSGCITLLAVGISFVLTIVASFMTLFVHPPTGIFMIGIALTLGGLGILLALLMSVVIKKGVPAMTGLIIRGFERIRGGRKVC